MPLSTAEPPLPSPRELLTSLFNSLPEVSSVQDSALPNNGRANTTSNPLKALSATYRSLFITLHVIFPSVFLQALDLLDRGLVTRVLQVVPSPSLPGDNSPQAQSHLFAPVATENLPNRSSRDGREHMINQNIIYLVRSAQSSHSNSRNGISSTRFGNRYGHGLSYIVRLQAWNCSCAAFAFSAFPGPTSAPFTPVFEDGILDAAVPSPTEREVEVPWQFGSLSLDGKWKDGEALSVPCCKHLMACLLVDRWKVALGNYVKEMRVGREEMAGLGVEGMV